MFTKGRSYQSVLASVGESLHEVMVDILLVRDPRTGEEFRICETGITQWKVDGVELQVIRKVGEELHLA